MESDIHPEKFGQMVEYIRRDRKMNQVDFYMYLFPDTEKEPENIKKKMNAIENGKQKSIDMDFLLRLCKKFEYSADYIFGLDSSYQNHEEEFICKYTGLEQHAVEQLHRWTVARDNDEDSLQPGNICSGDDCEIHLQYAYEKQSASHFLKIINLLFAESKMKRKKSPSKKQQSLSDLSILHYLYLLCLETPKQISGHMDCKYIEEMMKYEPNSSLANAIRKCKDHMTLDAEQILLLQGESTVYYPIDLSAVFKHIAEDHLLESIGWLVKQVKNDKTGK